MPNKKTFTTTGEFRRFLSLARFSVQNCVRKTCTRNTTRTRINISDWFIRTRCSQLISKFKFTKFLLMGLISIIFSSIFEYNTVKYVTVTNKKIGLLSRIIQLVIFGYIIGYVIVYKKGYQDKSGIESAVTTKVKGVMTTNFSQQAFNENISNWKFYNRVWDVPDFVIPPSENDAFFVATNVIMTSQTQNTCGEDRNVEKAPCDKRKNYCEKGTILHLGNGVLTGQCIDSFWGGENQTTCAIHGWCPVEEDFGPLKNGSGGLLYGTRKFTVLIKNFISFPKYQITRRNILLSSNKTYLHHCTYDETTDSQCPKFVLEDIVNYAGHDYKEMSQKGGVIAIIIDWTCNLDLSIDKCIPTYSFKRLDAKDPILAKGWNFRYANYFRDYSRTLYKVYGIDFVIHVRGSGGKFNFIPLLLNIGSGIGLLAIVSLICDLVVLYFVKKRKLYKDNKYYLVKTEFDNFSDFIPGLRKPNSPPDNNDMEENVVLKTHRFYPSDIV